MEENIETLNLLINNFIGSFDDRSAIFSVYNKPVIQKMLQWYLITWKNWLSFGDKLGYGSQWFMLNRIVHEGIKKIGKRTIDVKQHSFTVSFLKIFKEHIEENKEEKVESDGEIWHYKDYLYSVFFELLVEFITVSDISQREFMWREFPADWKITFSNLRNKEKIFAHLSLKEFMNWAQGRIPSSQGKEFDEPLHDIAANLFPETDSETWEIILIFILSPYAPEARVKSVIECPWTVGYSSARTFSFRFETPVTEEERKKIITRKHDEMEAKIKVGTQKAYELALLLFHDDFSTELIGKYTDEGKNLKYAEESNENRKRKKLLGIFTGLLEHLSEK